MSFEGKKKILVIELWGLGDSVFLTTFLLQAFQSHCDVTLLSKRGSFELLKSSYPKLKHIEWEAPWTAFFHKYNFVRWNWKKIIQILQTICENRFDQVISVREDPRDHAFMYLTGIPHRVGFRYQWLELFLTDSLIRPSKKQHRVDDWKQIARHLWQGAEIHDPHLIPTPLSNSILTKIQTAIQNDPFLVFHLGARIKVRRWDPNHFLILIRWIQEHTPFKILLIPDLDGYGSSLEKEVDLLLENLSMEELVNVIAASSGMVGNDSAPAHIAASLEKPVFAIFGPTDPDLFRPYGSRSVVAIQNLCPRRPCFDYCIFTEPYCMTALSIEYVMKIFQNWAQDILFKEL